MRHPMMLMLAVPFAAIAVSSPAFAHAHLKTAEPPVNGVVAKPPSEVTIDFTEGVEPKFSSIEVLDAQGQRVDQGDAHTAPGNASQFTTGLKAMAPGVYKVIWHATAVDTHKTDGTYQFTVKP